MHEVFSAIRVWQLHTIQHLPKHADAVAERLFGKSRWAEARSAGADADSQRDSLLNTAFSILHSTGYYDEPSDTARTITNMELATITYIDAVLPNMDNWPIWVEDVKRPKGRVGIELAFDVTLLFDDHFRVRYIGTIDALCESHRHDRKRFFLDENKTASRLDEGWRRSFEMSNQVTGYCAASTTVFGFPVFNARIQGLKLKQSGYDANYYPAEVARDEVAIRHWARWLRWTVEHLQDPFANGNFEDAPRFTHSCNRYFRPCSLISFCNDTPEGRIEQWNEMVPTPPSPSERAIAEM